MPLHGDHIGGADARGAREPSRFARGKCIGHARKTRQKVVPVLVGRGRAITPATRNSPRYRCTCQGDTRRACRRALANRAGYIKERARCWCRARCSQAAYDLEDLVWRRWINTTSRCSCSPGQTPEAETPAGILPRRGRIRCNCPVDPAPLTSRGEIHVRLDRNPVCSGCQH